MNSNSEPSFYREHYLELLNLSRNFKLLEFQKILSKTYEKLGTESFIIEFIAPFVNFIGLSWENEDISIANEHFCSDQITKFIYRKNIDIHKSQGIPKVLLTTIPNESHAIGIAMAESILSLNGAECLSLCAETPLDEIVKTAIISQSNIIGLSFSGHIEKKIEEASLMEIKKILPKTIDIWVGGSFSGTKIDDVQYLHLEDIKEALADWRIKNIYSN
jgi:methylmalonyl-CoA mutase cobalamin-binding subunit